MPRRLILVLMPSLTATTAFANQDSWSCQQDKASNEWVCLGGQTGGAAASASEATPAAEPAVTEQPASPAQQPQTSAPASTTEATPATSTPQPSAAEEQAPPPNPETAAAPVQPTRAAKLPEATDFTEGFNIGLLGPVFDSQQELVFADLTSRLKQDPWANCSLDLASNTSSEQTPIARNKAPVDVKSNYSEIFDNEIGSYVGKVELHRADQNAYADNANYDSVSETLDLHGNVYYNDEEFALHSNSATIKLASDQAKLRDTLFIASSMPLRGYAKAAYRDNKWLSHYQDVAYTSCRPGNQDWAIHAGELKINRLSGRGAAKNAWMEFKGVPVFYSPYLAFPVDNRRSSGFLAPSFGNTQTGGFNFTTPYYWNIAPNYDATFSPVYFSRRGLLLGGSFRYLTAESFGQAKVEYMPNDSKFNGSRHHLMFKHHTQFNEHLDTNLDLNTVSDKNYFAELGNALNFPNFSFVKSQADLNYLREGVAFTTRVESYQTIDSSLTPLQIPYRRLPQVKLDLNHAFDFMPLDAAIETETVNFQHSSLVDGQRINFKPSVSFPLHSDLGYVTPKVSVQHTEYFLNNQLAGLPRDIARTLPIFSVDAGTLFERDVSLADKAMLHTLEPRLFYLYIPKTNQNQIPLFDTTVYDFWYQNLFRENRFSGSDRVQDANQISLALTSRLVDPVNGRERLKLNIGEILYFRNRDVTLDYLGFHNLNLSTPLPYTTVDTSRNSPLVVELSSELSRHLAIDTGVQWDHQHNRIVRGKAMLHFINEPEQIINLGYLYRQDPAVPNRLNDITQSDASFRWPLFATWYAVGRWQYSWLYNRTLDGFFGLEKENCCWRFRVIGRTYLNSINQLVGSASQAVEGSTQTGIFFQIELKGLTGLGAQLDDFFEKSIYGYRKPTR